MEDSLASHLSDEAQVPGRGISDASVRSSLQDVGGEEAVGGPEPMREELVQSAVSFLKHPKVLASSDVQRRSFLEKKGLTVDEIDEAFRRLLSPSSDSMSLNTCTYQGVDDHSSKITQEKPETVTTCMDDSGRPEPETESVDPVVPRHPKSYMEIMEMIQRGERPDDIQDINDDPPNPDQPISESRMAPKPKPWEMQGQESSNRELKSQSTDTIELISEVQHDSTNQFTGTGAISKQMVAASEAHTDDAASTKS
ncbi:peroxisomal membrane protein PEX14-like [Oryza brachyantha]|uniref:Peroxisomal membrane protein PEX14 n=1 Tax=Oryza brachyantha TaxID=4533 RepID=J3MA20_ORYBR|nr:peroxisomal membrane protein PEX14-like [Oryza brachyantha]